jgi:inorganic pyrophosphatase
MTKPTKLPHDLDHEDYTCRAVIETPKGSRSKFDYDPESGLFLLAGLVPAGMSFPLSFGFIPSTRAEDGDPLDVMVLHDETIPVGSLVSVRLLGVIEGDQTEDGETVRNDRLLAVTTCSHEYEQIKDIEQLGGHFLKYLTQFWVNYNALKGKRYNVRGVHGPKHASEAIRKTSKH